MSSTQASMHGPGLKKDIGDRVGRHRSLVVGDVASQTEVVVRTFSTESFEFSSTIVLQHEVDKPSKSIVSRASVLAITENTTSSPQVPTLPASNPLPSLPSQAASPTKPEPPAAEFQAIARHEAELQRTITAVVILVPLLMGLVIIYAAYCAYKRLQSRRNKPGEPSGDRRSHRTRPSIWRRHDTRGAAAFHENLEEWQSMQDSAIMASRADANDLFSYTRPVSTTSSLPSYRP